jgi:hypothetical protein
MAKAKKWKQRQCRKIGETIDAIEKAASTAARIYRIVGPIAKTILKQGEKTR